MDTVRPSDSAPPRDTMIPTAPRLEEFHRLRLNLQNFRAAAQWSVTGFGTSKSTFNGSAFITRNPGARAIILNTWRIPAAITGQFGRRYSTSPQRPASGEIGGVEV